VTLKEFCKAMETMGCSGKEISQTTAMIGRFCRSYTWLVRSELFAIALENVEKARATYNPLKTASPATWYITVVKSSIRTHIKKEQKSRSRYQGSPAADTGVYVDSDGTHDRDVLLGLLAQIVSPAAWAVVQVIIHEHPRKISNAMLGRKLRLSPRSISRLRNEITYAETLLIRKV